MLRLGFAEFDTIPDVVSRIVWHTLYESAALTKHELEALQRIVRNAAERPGRPAFSATGSARC
ncbi:MAG: hypothetical protein OHK0048_11140 [Rhodoferax sp.]